MSEPLLNKSIHELKVRLPALQAVLPPLTEADTCGGIIEPILRSLGWDTSDVLQVRRQYRHNQGDNPVDYGLLLDGVPVLFVEAKSLSGDLDDPRWRNQTLAYAYHTGVAWCVLTNGAEWRLFKTMAPGDATSRLFRKVRLSDEDASSTLMLIGPEAIAEGEAGLLWDAEYADRLVRPAYEAAINSRQFTKMVRDALAEPLSFEQVQAAISRIGHFASPPISSLSTTDNLPAADHPPVKSEILEKNTIVRHSSGRAARRRAETVSELLSDGRIAIGENVRIRNRPGSDAKIIDAKTVNFKGQIMTWNGWGNLVTGWPTINIYLYAENSAGRLLDSLRTNPIGSDF